MRRTSYQNFTGREVRKRRRTTADRKTDFSREKARTQIDVFGLKSIYNSIQLICQFPP